MEPPEPISHEFDQERIRQLELDMGFGVGMCVENFWYWTAWVCKGRMDKYDLTHTELSAMTGMSRIVMITLTSPRVVGGYSGDSLVGHFPRLWDVLGVSISWKQIYTPGLRVVDIYVLDNVKITSRKPSISHRRWWRQKGKRQFNSCWKQK